MLNIIKKHPKRTVILACVILFIIAVIIISKILKLSTFYVVHSEQTQQIFFLYISLENWCTIVSTAAIFGGAIWGLMQYDKTVKIRQQEKATIIAHSFSDKLTLKCMLVCSVIENSPLNEFLDIKNIDCFNFTNFNTTEIRQVYNNDDFLEQYNKLKELSDLDNIYYNILESRISTEPLCSIAKKHTSYTTWQARKLFVLDNEGLSFSFENLMYDVLNELEYLCMGLASHAAGSAFVYQSLHQVFLRTIRVLAVEIALSNNTYYSDKYYTNIIEVYNAWKKLYSKNLKSEKKLKKKVDKMLNPKINKV